MTFIGCSPIGGRNKIVQLPLKQIVERVKRTQFGEVLEIILTDNNIRRRACQQRIEQILPQSLIPSLVLDAHRDAGMLGFKLLLNIPPKVTCIALQGELQRPPYNQFDRPILNGTRSRRWRRG